MNSEPRDNLIPLRAVGEMIGGFCKRTVERMIAAGELPRPVKVRSRACLPESEVRAYLERMKREGRS